MGIKNTRKTKRLIKANGVSDKQDQEARMRILHISARLPYPLYKGDALRGYYQIKYLSRRHSIVLLSFIESQEQLRYLPELEKFCDHVETVLLSRNRSFLNATFSFFSKMPLQVNYFRSSQMRKKIKWLLQTESFDLVHLQSIRVAPYLIFYENIPRVIDLIDAQSIVMKRRFKRERLLLKPIFYLEWQRVKNYELDVCADFNQVIVVSEAEKEAIQTKVAIAVNHNGVDTEIFSLVSEGREPSTLVFTGNMGYFPNVDAVMYFTQEIFPIVKKRIPSVKFYIVGANPIRKIQRLDADQHIVVTGLVDNVHRHLKKATLSVCPMRAGSGIQNKVLEAMATGTPVVATDYAIGGLRVTHGQDIMVANKPTEFARRVIELLSNHELRQKISRNARRLVEKNYSWDSSIQQLEKIYQTAIRD